MSRELIIEHANTCIWSACTSQPFAGYAYDVLDKDEGELTASDLKKIRAKLQIEKRETLRERDKYEALLMCPTIGYEDYKDDYDTLQEVVEDIETLEYSIRLTAFFLDMLEEMGYSDEESDKRLMYTKSY